MAEKILTESELDSYLETIDMNVAENKRVLTALQMIHSNYMDDILYFLAMGTITIQELYSYNINNISAKLIIDNANNKGDTLLSYRNFYREKLVNMPTYKQFMSLKKASAAMAISRILVSSEKFIVPFVIDELGNTQGSFPSVNSAMELYDEVVFSPAVQELFAGVIAASLNVQNTYGITSFSTFISKVLAQMTEYRFLRSTDNQLNFDIGVDTITGYIIRECYLDLPYENLIANMNTIILKMAEKYDTDLTKTGFSTVSDLMYDEIYSYNIALVDSIIGREKIILDDLARVVHLRKTLYSEIYGAAFLPPESIQYELDMYTAIMDTFRLTHDFAIVLINELKTKFGVVTDA